MSRFLLNISVSVVGLLLAVSPLAAEQLTTGQKEFATYCAPCHGVAGEGDGPVSFELMKRPADLTMLAKTNGGTFDADRIKMIIDGRAMPRSHGTPQMPVWGRWFAFQATAGGLLQEDRKAIEKQVNKRLENLVGYLRSIQR
jgi:mono/diheme cytochrome c family protein